MLQQLVYIFPTYQVRVSSLDEILTQFPRAHTDTGTGTGTHTHLLRTIIANSDVKCIVRAKTLQLHLTGMGRWKDPRRYRKVSIAIAYARCNKLEADTSLSPRPNLSHLDRLRKPYRDKIEVPRVNLLWQQFEKLFMTSDTCSFINCLVASRFTRMRTLCVRRRAGV